MPACEANSCMLTTMACCACSGCIPPPARQAGTPDTQNAHKAGIHRSIIAVLDVMRLSQRALYAFTAAYSGHRCWRRDQQALTDLRDRYGRVSTQSAHLVGFR